MVFELRHKDRVIYIGSREECATEGQERFGLSFSQLHFYGQHKDFTITKIIPKPLVERLKNLVEVKIKNIRFIEAKLDEQKAEGFRRLPHRRFYTELDLEIQKSQLFNLNNKLKTAKSN